MSVLQYGSLIERVSTTATSGGTTTLINTSNELQVFTGTTTQTVVLPNATTFTKPGGKFEFYNNSTGIVTVEYQDTTTFKTIPPNSTLIIKLVNNGTANGTWVTLTNSATSSLMVPTQQKFASTGTTTGALFTISTTSTVAVGDTYSNNSNTFTVQGALTAQSGQVLFMSGTGSTSGTTLTRVTGSGTASITFSGNIPTASYTAPSPAPLYLRVRLVGSGGGGQGSSANGNVGSAGTGGSGTFFGPNYLTAGPGSGGANTVPGSGGSAAIAAGISGSAFAGTSGNPPGAQINVAATFPSGGSGGGTPFSGGGSGGYPTVAGTAPAANSGAGGAGAGAPSQGNGGSGGGSGGFIDALISGSNLTATIPYIVGSAGSGGGGVGSGANSGTNGADGYIEVTEYYQ